VLLFSLPIYYSHCSYIFKNPLKSSNYPLVVSLHPLSLSPPFPFLENPTNTHPDSFSLPLPFSLLFG